MAMTASMAEVAAVHLQRHGREFQQRDVLSLSGHHTAHARPFFRTFLSYPTESYWTQRKNLIAILRYLATMGIKIPHWGKDAEAARLLAGAIENDSY
jgi:hypothetical protein